jgi:uncharacterized repeat protein (TIGR03803 family)
MNPKKHSHLSRAVLALAALTFTLAIGANAQTESLLYSFTGGADGGNPNGGLISDSAGNLYGTTFSGGNLSACGGAGCGVVFKLSPGSSGWTETVLHTFSGRDGANPTAPLMFGVDGNLYGTTSAGGTLACSGAGCGVVFKLAPRTSGWTERVLYNFGGGTDGSSPYYQLVTDAAGNLYGTTLAGGALVDCASHTAGCGTVYRLSGGGDIGWTFKVLYSFSDSDSSSPSSPLILDPSGNLLGSGVGGSGGVIYRLSPSGGSTWKNTLLYFFGGTNGNYPQGLIYGGNTNFYGITYQGGSGGSLEICENLQPGCGTAFQLSVTSTAAGEAVLHNFDGFDANPNGSLIFIKGSLYGADSTDVFALSRLGVSGIWKKTVLHTFDDTGDGFSPRAPLLIDASGNLFGVTYQGGATGNGTIFQITP